MAVLGRAWCSCNQENVKSKPWNAECEGAESASDNLMHLSRVRLAGCQLVRGSGVPLLLACTNRGVTARSGGALSPRVKRDKAPKRNFSNGLRGAVCTTLLGE